MEDEEQKAPGPGAANRTIQIDALTDVQLVDQVAGDDEAEADDASLGGVSAPPPLPRKQAEADAPRSNARAAGLTLVAVVAGGFFAYLVVHYLLPSGAPPQAAAGPSYSAASTAALPPTSGSTEAAPASEVRHVQIDEEMVIHAADPGE